jgi:hypothetical protein
MHLIHSFYEINWLAVVVSIVLSFALGALWHSVLFKKSWSEDSGSIYNSQNHGNPAVIFGLSGILHVVLVIGLAMFIGQHDNFSSGALKGLFISIVWISTSIGVTYIFVGRTFRLFLIDAGFYVVFLSLAGMLLGAWH